MDEGKGSVKKTNAEATLELRSYEGFNLLESRLLETGKAGGRALAAPHETEAKISPCSFVPACSKVCSRKDILFLFFHFFSFGFCFVLFFKAGFSL